MAQTDDYDDDSDFEDYATSKLDSDVWDLKANWDEDDDDDPYMREIEHYMDH